MDVIVREVAIARHRFGPPTVEIDLPPAHVTKIRSVGTQGDRIILWIEMPDGYVGTGLRTFRLFATEQPIPAEYLSRDPDGYGSPGYVGTITDGLSALHIYEGQSKRKGQS